MKELQKIDEIKELSIKVKNLINKEDVFTQICTRGSEVQDKLIEFKTFDDEKLALLAERMPEINRATNTFGKQNSQTTGKLMSLNMISQSPYRRLKQCLAKIEKKRSALRANIFKLKKEKVKIDRLLFEKGQLEANLRKNPPADKSIHFKFDLEEINIKIESKACSISDATIYIEGALKEIGIYQDAYDEIKESYDIPDDWDEEDFEKCEVEEHVKTAFLHAVRDVEMTGRINVGTHEYLEQYGVNPHSAYTLVKQYLNKIQGMINNEEHPSIEILYEFLDKMHEIFKDEYKHAMKRIGLKNVISKDFLYLENKD